MTERRHSGKAAKRKLLAFALDERKNVTEWAAPIPNETKVTDEMDYESDDLFYRGDILTSSADNIYQFVSRIEKFEKVKKIRDKKAGRESTVRTFVYSQSLHQLLEMNVPENKSSNIQIARDPLRVGHPCYACQNLTNQEFKDFLCEQCSRRSKKYKNLSLNLKGKVALITGIRSKLGKAVALRLLKDDATVILFFFRTQFLAKMIKIDDFAGYWDK